MDLGELAEVAHAILPDLRCDLNNPLRYNLNLVLPWPNRSARIVPGLPDLEFLQMTTESHHDTLLRAAIQDRPTVTAAGEPKRRLTDGVRIRPLPTHFDQRGSVTELFDPRWKFHPDPLVFAYCFTIRPGVVKGWNLHQRHEDRYALIKGELELVLYDSRETSPTFKEVCVIRISETSRVLVTVPINVWHADFNVGTEDVIVANFPTTAYDHNDPDKWRLPIDTPLIPYSFPVGVRGG